MTLLSQKKPTSNYEQLPPPGVRVDGGAHRAAATEPTVGELTSRLGEQVSRLVREEIALAQLEAKQKAKRIGMGAGMFGAAGLLSYFGLACGITAAILGFANVLQAWLGAIIVGAICFIVAGLVALPGWKGIKEAHPVPEESVESLKADVAAVREAAQHRAG
jgi:hypothetical protein